MKPGTWFGLLVAMVSLIIEAVIGGWRAVGATLLAVVVVVPVVVIVVWLNDRADCRSRLRERAEGSGRREP